MSFAFQRLNDWVRPLATPRRLRLDRKRSTRPTVERLESRDLLTGTPYDEYLDAMAVLNTTYQQALAADQADYDSDIAILDGQFDAASDAAEAIYSAAEALANTFFDAAAVSARSAYDVQMCHDRRIESTRVRLAGGGHRLACG